MSLTSPFRWCTGHYSLRVGGLKQANLTFLPFSALYSLAIILWGGYKMSRSLLIGVFLVSIGFLWPNRRR